MRLSLPATNKIVNAVPVFSNTDGSVSGQQNLTFDGSQLKVIGRVNVSSNLNVGNKLFVKNLKNR